MFAVDDLEDVLTRRQLEVIQLRYVEHIPTDRLVAEHLGLCRSGVTRCRNRALARLAEHLGTAA